MVASLFKSRARLEAENAALLQQLVVLRRKLPGRAGLTNGDRLFFGWLYRLLPSVAGVMLLAQPETLVRWHRAGFRRYWRWKSRCRLGRPVDRCQVHGQAPGAAVPGLEDLPAQPLQPGSNAPISKQGLPDPSARTGARNDLLPASSRRPASLLCSGVVLGTHTRLRTHKIALWNGRFVVRGLRRGTGDGSRSFLAERSTVCAA